MGKSSVNIKGWRMRLGRFLRANISLAVVIAAAFLMELISGVMYYSTQRIIQNMMRQLADREMHTIDLSIRNRLAEVEVTVENMALVMQSELSEPDSMCITTHCLVEHNDALSAFSISFVPYYYPQKGRLFEPCSVRRADGTIESLQIASEDHDYTESEFYRVPMATGKGHWSEPYMDSDGVKAMVTTYGVPVRDMKDSIVAVVGADLSLGWLEEVMNEKGVYASTRRFIMTGSHNRLAGKDVSLFNRVLKVIGTDTDNDGYVTLTDDDGVKQHLFFNPVGGKTNWVLISVVSDKDVFGTLRHVRLYIMLMTLAGLLLMGFIVWRTSRSIERLRRVNAERERIGGELRVASQIQQSMLPQRHLLHDDVEICGSLVPAREVGGDLFDCFIRDGKLFFCIGDVSGKGVPSAMFMAVTYALFRSASAHESNPARIMHTINETACHGNDSNMFVTMFIGVLDLPTGHLRYCNAGHDVPIVLTEKPMVRIETLECSPNLPVGVFNDMKYTMQEIFLHSGCTLFLYTDGLTEARDDQRRQFGFQRAEELLSRCAEMQLKPKELLKTISEEVRSFEGDAEQSDDLTMLAIRYTPRHFESKLIETIVLKNNICDVALLSSFMKSVAEKLNLEQSQSRQLRLGVEEAVVNVMDYAYPTDTVGSIEVCVMSDGHNLKIIITDSGIPFDPTAKEKTDTTLSAEERQVGGLGILIVRDLMDSINYERIDGKNILTLVKNISQNNKNNLNK